MPFGKRASVILKTQTLTLSDEKKTKELKNVFKPDNCGSTGEYPLPSDNVSALTSLNSIRDFSSRNQKLRPYGETELGGAFTSTNTHTHLFHPRCRLHNMDFLLAYIYYLYSL